MVPVVAVAGIIVVSLLTSFNVTANEETQNISYTSGSSTTVCVHSIDYDSCPDAAMKLSYQIPNSNSSVGELFLNMVYNPDRVVAKINTTKYGFSNITSKRNRTNVCFNITGMSEIANGKVLIIHQICGVTKLENEKKQRLVFHLVSSPKTIPSSTYASTTTEKSSKSGLSSTATPSQAPGERRPSKGLSKDGIVGIALGCIVLFLAVLIYLIVRWYKHRNERTGPMSNNNFTLK